jgi:hypothetical protein
MKKALLAILIIGSVFTVAWAQPKVAVLDSIIPQNMDPSVISPATDRIIEKLVQSNRFTVLDRANIESVLKEREFQVSGMVSDQDAVTAGKYLGADFIVVSKISKVGDTNFMSGKMINVKTGVIVSTTSAQGEGKLAVVINLAGQVGEVLAGGVAKAAPDANVVVAPPPPVDVVPVSPGPAPADTVPADDTPSPPKKQLARSFMGMGFFINSDKWKEEDTYGSYTYKETDTYNFVTLQFAAVTSKFVQFGVGLSFFTGGSFEWENTSNGASASGDLWSDISATWLDLNLMFRLPLRVGSGFAIVPLFGMEIDLNMSVKDSAGNDLKQYMTDEFKSSLNKVYLQIGLGIQIDAGPVVIYPEFIYGFKIKSAYDTDVETNAIVTRGWSDSSVSEGKLDIGVVVGFKLN